MSGEVRFRDPPPAARGLGGMHKYISLSLFALLAACSNETNLGSGSNQDALSDSEVICAKMSALPCGPTRAECLSTFADQDQLAQARSCTGEVDAMLTCGRGLELYCEDGEVTADGCFDEQQAASECMYGSPSGPGGCGGSSTTYEQPDQHCDAYCTDGTRVSCSGDQSAVTCVCEAGPQVGHTFALLSCTTLDDIFLTECYDPPSQGTPEACGGGGTTEENGRQSCDATCQGGVSVSCEGPTDGPVVCDCAGNGHRFALTGCDALPSHVPTACQ